MRSRLEVYVRGAAFLCACWLITGAGSSETKMMRVARAELCVTEGAIEESANGGMRVSTPKMRAYVNVVTPQVVEARFTYLGSTGNEARLGSGELRRQFGLKLRATDACNLVYAMWRIEPESKLVVSVKSNPGQLNSAECGNRGYKNIRAKKSRPVAVLRVGDPHSLRAEMRADELNVFVDNVLVWEGSVGAEGGAFEGPVGLRSDNARLQLELLAGEPLAVQRGHAPGCRTGPEAAE